MKEYYAIILDLVKSTELDENDRYQAQKKLNQSITLINKFFTGSIVKSMSFSAGDSVQGLFNNVHSACNVFYLVSNIMFPYFVRCGIGKGEINNKLISEFNSNDSNVYDGKAYHLARSGLDNAKNFNYNLFINTDSYKDFMINTLINDSSAKSMTIIQHSLYSMINIIEPIGFDTSCFLSNYLDEILNIVIDKTEYYRKSSQALTKAKKNKKYSNVIEIDIKRTLKDYEKGGLNTNKLSDIKNNSILVRNESTISSEIREFLVQITSSTSQNIGSIIRKSNMDEMRKKDIAKLLFVRHFYGGEEL